MSDIEDYINKNESYCENIICYERKRFDSYDLIKNRFSAADAVIFTSVYGAKIFFENLYEVNRKISFFCISQRIKKQIDLMGYETKIINYFSDNLYLEIEKAI